MKSTAQITKKLIKERGRICEYCGVSDDTIVGHHAYSRSLYPEWKYKEWNFVLLHYDCHTGENGVENGNKEIDKFCKELADKRREGYKKNYKFMLQ